MNAPREPEERDDELLAAYQRASAQEGHGPDPRVRESILAQVRRDHAPAAANDGRWRARAAAGIAVLGLVGWLAMRGGRNSPRETDALVTTDSMAAAPSAAAAPAAVLPPRRVAAPRAADSVGTARSSAAPPRAVLPRAVLPRDETLVRRAVTARFAGLFLPEDSEYLNLVIVLMDRNGGIARAAVATASASAAQGDGPVALGDFQSLGLRADEIAAPGFIRLVEKAAAAGAPDEVLLVRYAWTRDSGQ